MNDSSKLCLSCGVCCDGTLIGFVSLDTEEIPAVREVMDIEEEDGNGFFLQPCAKFCDGCTIYDDRPKQCGLFKCGLLKSFEEKEIDFTSTAAIIADIKSKRVSIEMELARLQIELNSPSFYFKMVELRRRLLRQKLVNKASKEELSLLKDIIGLDHLMQEKFGVAIN